MDRRGEAQTGTLKLIKLDFLDLDGDFHFAMRAAHVAALNRGNILIIPTDRDFYEAVIRECVVRGIITNPSRMRKVDFDPCV